MNRCILILAATVILSTAAGTRAQPNRVGIFDRQAVALAYYRSPQFAADLAQHRAELGEARRANDTERIRELNAWLSDTQELAHRQVFEGAPIPNILEALKAAFAQIEKAQHLASVVPGLAAPSAETIDVTPQLLAWLDADDQTRRLIQEMVEQRK